MAGDADLAKRTPGTPLSEAELQQRKDAARSRWEGVRYAGLTGAGATAGAGVGAAAGFVGARLATRGARNSAYSEVRALAQGIRAARARNAARMARHEAATDAAVNALRGRKLLPAAKRTLASEVNRAGKALRDHLDANSEPYQIEPGEPMQWATLDLPGEMERRGRLQRLRDQLAELRQRGADPRQVPVAGSVQLPKVDSFSRRVKRPPAFQWSQVALEDMADPQGAIASEFGRQMSQADLEEMLRGPHRRGVGAVLRNLGMRPRRIEQWETQTVRNAVKVIPPHTQRVEGWPDAKGRKKLADQIRDSIQQRAAAWRARENIVAPQRVSAARSSASIDARPALDRLFWLRRPARIGGFVAGALIGAGLGGWTAYRATRRDDDLTKVVHVGRPAPLAKANDDSGTAPDPAAAPEQIVKAGDAAGDTIAERLARTFRDWKDEAAGHLLGDEAGALGNAILSGIEYATAPIAQAWRGGAGTTVPLVTAEADGEPKTVSFTFSARNPMVEKFLTTYRRDRIVQLSDDQRAAVRDVLLGAARTGASPDQMARDVRATIGLTANQAAQVLSYRRQLETLDPRVLTRALRDKRYDRVLNRAMLESQPLSDEQVDRMTDAYHRRYLAYRAMTIARTEGVGAANNGHIASTQAWLDAHPGFTVIKTWISTEDERTRPDHVDLHGQSVIGLETPFTCISGDTIRWPHDQNAAARQVVNCRCTVATQLVSRAVAAKYGSGALDIDTPDQYEHAQ